MDLESIMPKKMLLWSTAIIAMGAALVCTPQPSTAQENDQTFANPTEQQMISWHTSIDEALAEAKKNNKLVLVDVYKDRCGWCQALDERVFKNSEVSKFISENFVCLKSNAEVGEGVKVVSVFEVYSFPTTLILKSDGKKVGKIIGFHKPQKFTKKLKKLIKKAK